MNAEAAALALTGIQITRAIMEIVDDLNSGALTYEEALARWTAVSTRFREAEALWEQADQAARKS